MNNCYSFVEARKVASLFEGLKKEVAAPPVAKGKDEILPDVAHSGTAQADGLRDAAEVAFHQRDARALHGHVGAGTHGDTDFGFTQSRCVIDAVASHGDVIAFLTKLFDMGHFFIMEGKERSAPSIEPRVPDPCSHIHLVY